MPGFHKSGHILDLAAGYWQIQVDEASQVTQQGLFEFHIMPFGLTKVPVPCFSDSNAVVSTQLMVKNLWKSTLTMC